MYDPPQLEKLDEQKLCKPLGPYNIPHEWTWRIQDGRAADELEDRAERLRTAELVRTAQPNELAHVYVELYKRLLWSEESQLHEDLATFDLIDEHATELHPRGGGLLAVHVRGLAENRPSVLRGDLLRVNHKENRRVRTPQRRSCVSSHCLSLSVVGAQPFRSCGRAVRR